MTTEKRKSCWTWILPTLLSLAFPPALSAEPVTSIEVVNDEGQGIFSIVEMESRSGESLYYNETDANGLHRPDAPIPCQPGNRLIVRPKTKYYRVGERSTLCPSSEVVVVTRRQVHAKQTWEPSFTAKVISVSDQFELTWSSPSEASKLAMLYSDLSSRFSDSEPQLSRQLGVLSTVAAANAIHFTERPFQTSENGLGLTPNFQHALGEELGITVTSLDSRTLTALAGDQLSGVLGGALNPNALSREQAIRACEASSREVDDEIRKLLARLGDTPDGVDRIRLSLDLGARARVADLPDVSQYAECEAFRGAGKLVHVDYSYSFDPLQGKVVMSKKLRDQIRLQVHADGQPDTLSPEARHVLKALVGKDFVP